MEGAGLCRSSASTSWTRGGGSARRAPLSARGLGLNATSPPARYRWTQRRAVRRDRPCCRAKVGSGTPSSRKGRMRCNRSKAAARLVSERFVSLSVIDTLPSGVTCGYGPVVPDAHTRQQEKELSLSPQRPPSVRGFFAPNQGKQDVKKTTLGWCARRMSFVQIRPGVQAERDARRRGWANV